MRKKIEEKYQAMSEIQHVLMRPGMWVGATSEEERQVFIYDSEENKMTMKDVTYSPAMLKLFDEILSNSCDEYRRKDNMGLTKVVVSLDKANGQISVTDDGGIPVAMHKEAKMYVPEFIFGQLRTSSNYDDTEDRNVIGTNGVGSSITNIFSNSFNVTTCDSKNMITVEWSDHMSKKNTSKITKSKEHYTSIEYELDFSLFDGYDLHGYTEDFALMAEKRCIDAAAANLGLKVEFTLYDNGNKQRNSKWKFNKFEDYMTLYDDFYDPTCVISLKDKQKQIWICPDSQIDVAFVNGAECSRGTHIKAVRYPVGHAVGEILKKKHKIDVTNKGIDNKYGIFGIFDISNPSYSSQTKEELTTAEENFYKDGSTFDIPDDFLKKVQKSEIVELVVDWYKKKVEAEDQAKLRKINREASKGLKRSDKFIDCNSKKRQEKQLWIFEGDSAGGGFRQCRTPMTQAGYLMRGVPLNVISSTATQVMKNQVFNDIVTIIGLQWGQYNKAEDLKFGKIVISSDADPDGDKIAALLLVFFNHFPELFEQGLICRSISPIIVASKGKPKTKGYDTKSFYSFEEYKKEEKKLKGYEIKHVKGLGTMNTVEYRQMMQNPIFHYFTKDEMADLMLKKWFGKGIAQERREMLKEDVEA